MSRNITKALRAKEELFGKDNCNLNGGVIIEEIETHPLEHLRGRVDEKVLKRLIETIFWSFGGPFYKVEQPKGDEPDKSFLWVLAHINHWLYNTKKRLELREEVDKNAPNSFYDTWADIEHYLKQFKLDKHPRKKK